MWALLLLPLLLPIVLAFPSPPPPSSFSLEELTFTHEDGLALAQVQSKARGQCVPIDPSPFIPVPPEVLQAQLKRAVSRAEWGDSQPSTPPEQREALWDDLCNQLKMVLSAELKELRDTLLSSYQPFDPARSRWIHTWPKSDEEVEFARDLLRTANLAGFEPVSRKDLQRTRELNDLLSLPVQIHWDRLDSRWIERLFQEEERGLRSEERRHLDPKLSDFGSYVLVLKRGVSLETKEGLLLMQKLDSVQSRWLLTMGRLLKALIAFTFKLAAAGYDVARDAAAAHGGLLPVAGRRVALWARRQCRRQCRRRTIVLIRRRFKIARLATRLRRAGYLGGRVADAARRLAVRAWPWVRERLRGLRMRLEGTQVLRKLQPGRYQYTYWLFDNVLGKGRWSKERAALIQRLSDAWRKEAELRALELEPSGARGPPTGTPRLPARGASLRPEAVAARERRAARLRGEFVERVTMDDLDLSFKTMWQPTQLQEPQFQEILVVYRLQEPSANGLFGEAPQRPLPQRSIHVRRFTEVPMKDIKMVLPQEAWRVRGRPLDMIKLDLITLFGVCSVVSRLMGRTHGFFALVPIVVLLLQTFLRQRRIRVYHNSVTSSMLFDRCLDKDAALMRLLPDSAEAQIFAECALAYWAIIDLTGNADAAEVGVQVEDVQRHATKALRGMIADAGLPEAGVWPSFERGLGRLEQWGLVQREPHAGELGGDLHKDARPRSLRPVDLAHAPGVLYGLRSQLWESEKNVWLD